MKVIDFTYKKTNSFSNLIIDLNEGKNSIKPFINREFDIKKIPEQIQEKSKQSINRKSIVKALKNQYKDISITNKVASNIDKLILENTFTISAGHQLCLFTGPLYYLYKIISVLNLTEHLNFKYPQYNFIPIYWMGSEDHDFEEINHFNVFSKKICWNKKTNSQAVGRMDTDNLLDVFNDFKQVLGNSEHGNTLLKLFKDAYLQNNTMAFSQRFLVNNLFGKYGLVCLDSDDQILKNNFISFVKKDILKSSYKQLISNTSFKLDKDYHSQAYARNINHFYIDNRGVRSRIYKDNKTYNLLKQKNIFTDRDIQQEIENNPKSFSQNVLTRALFKEFTLPNLVTIGGGGELAYWLQMKDVFAKEKIVFPMLKLRNSALIIDKINIKKLDKLNIQITEIFKNKDELILNYIKQKSSTLNLLSEKKLLEEVFTSIESKAIDDTLKRTIKSEKKKNLNTLNVLEKKLIKHEKKFHEDSIKKIESIKEKLFPNNTLQERYVNFSQFYLNYGDMFIDHLKIALKEDREFSLILID